VTELDDALADYARHRSPELARAIELLGRAALAGFTPPKPRTNAEFHAAWQRLARAPASRTWCLDTLIEKLPPDKHDTLCERLDVLGAVPPDPRIAQALVAAQGFAAPVVGWVKDKIPPVIARHAATTATLPPAIAARWRKVAPPPTRDPAALYAAVYAAPDDDGPRAVLADALQEAGDPRGELIALQLREHAGSATPELRDRAQALIQEHAKAWLGPLRPIIYRATMRRGFLHRVELAGSWSVPAGQWRGLAAEPMFATVEELVMEQATGKVYAEVVTGAARTLREIEVRDGAVWKVVATTPMPRLNAIRSLSWKPRNRAAAIADEVIPWVAAHQQITTFGCRSELLAALPEPLLARLAALETDTLAGALPTWKANPTLPRLRCVWDGLELIRDPDRTWARLVSDRTGSSLPDLKRLPKEITYLEVLNNAKDAKAIQAQYGTRFEVVSLRPPSGAITGLK
jgi:uncharacterized protein (TIGR02996 family)